MNLVVGQSVLAPPMPLSHPHDLAEGIIVGLSESFVRVRFPEGVRHGSRIPATVVTMRPDLVRPSPPSNPYNIEPNSGPL
jgi:hypothetical protein